MELGLALLERLDGDVVLSPYGLARALNVIRGGATGETRAALEAVVAPVGAVDGIVSARAVWLGEGYTAGPALAGIDSGPLEVERINAWSNERTRGMIPRILEEIAGDEIFALTDAEYLDAKWVFPFERERAGLMGVDGTFEHTEDAVRLPYRDGDLRFVAMMGDVPATWTEGYGTVELPRFSTTSALELAGPLIELGLEPAFRPGRDLEQLVVGPGDKGLGRIVQRARVDVDEAGTRAAATTALTMRAVAYREPTFHIVFDRPFTWAVEHAPTGTLLFLGRVLNPTERSD
jgi:serine protease inhibitor